MSSAEFDNFIVKQNEYPTYDDDKKKEVLGRLKQLEDLVTYLNVVRESYTREMVVNGYKGSEEGHAEKPEDGKKHTDSDSDSDYRPSP